MERILSFDYFGKNIYHIDHVSDLSCDYLNIVEKPSFDYRQVNYAELREDVTSYRRMRMQPAPEQYVTGNEYHNSIKILTYKAVQSGATKESVVSEYTNKGWINNGQLCYSNVEMRSAYIESLKLYLNSNYCTLVDLMLVKKNVILQGAPGVGKTFAARRLAYSMMGVQDSERVMMVQFHQSYSYEDFIMGYRPTENGGFVLKKGPFYNFCKKAENDSDNDYFFIIDEINRGNLSKIFGELFMLVEADKRAKVKLQLLYSDEKFSVPENVYIIGMMNTADRSLAMLDYALRRRFAFYEMKPGFDNEKFVEYRMNLNNPKFDKLIDVVQSLNNAIATDESLGEGFKIGHSYFCNIKEINESRLSNIVEYELIPMLKEYWFDEPIKVKDWSNLLRGAVK